MLSKRRTLIFIWLIDCAFTLVFIGRCDNYVTPKETALGFSVILLLSYILCAAVSSGFRPRFKPGLSGLFLLLWVAALAVSAAAAARPHYSFGEMRLPVLYVLAYYAVRWSSSKDESPAFMALSAPVIFAFIFSFHGIIQYLGLDFLPNFSRYSHAGAKALGVYSLFGNSNLLADFLAPVFPLAAALVFLADFKKKQKTIAAFAATAIFAALILTGARAALLAAVCGSVVLSAAAASYGGKKPKRLILIAAALATVAIISISTIFVPGKKYSIPMRFVYWKAAISMFEKQPVLGGGPGFFKLDYINFQKEYFKSPHPKDIEMITLIEKPGHPHNEYLNSLADSGALGFLFLALAIGSGIALGFSVAARGSFTGAAWAASLVAFAAAAFFSFPLRVPTTGILLPIALAFIDDMQTTGAEPVNSVPLPAALYNRFARSIIIAAIVICAAFAVYKVFIPLEARFLLTNAKRSISMNRPDLALSQTEKALGFYPDDGEILFTQGVIYLATGRPKEALPFLIKSKLTSGDPSVYYNISLAYSELGDMTRAISNMLFYTQAIPADFRAKIFLSVYYYKIGEAGDALRELSKARRLTNDKNVLQQISQYEALIREGGMPSK
ncbi:MAG: O-antigen ligase family protein [bacterium]